MSNEHKRPILAFVVLAVIAAAVIGNQFRASAEGFRFIVSGPIAAHTSLTRGEVAPAPAVPPAATAGKKAADRAQRPSMASAITDALSARPAADAPTADASGTVDGASNRPADRAPVHKPGMSDRPDRAHADRPVQEQTTTPAGAPAAQPVPPAAGPVRGVRDVVRKPLATTAEALANTLAAVARPDRRDVRQDTGTRGFSAPALVRGLFGDRRDDSGGRDADDERHGNHHGDPDRSEGRRDDDRDRSERRRDDDRDRSERHRGLGLGLDLDFGLDRDDRDDRDHDGDHGLGLGLFHR